MSPSDFLQPISHKPTACSTHFPFTCSFAGSRCCQTVRPERVRQSEPSAHPLAPASRIWKCHWRRGEGRCPGPCHGALHAICRYSLCKAQNTFKVFPMNSSAAQSIPGIITHIIYHSKQIPFETKSLIVTYFLLLAYRSF